jgi:hypothetical protein
LTDDPTATCRTGVPGHLAHGHHVIGAVRLGDERLERGDVHRDLLVVRRVRIGSEG